MSRALRFLLPVVLAVAFLLQVQRSSQLMRAQHLLYSVELRTMAMLRSGTLDKGKLRGNIAALKDARDLDRAEVGIPTLTGGQHLMLGEVDPALTAYLIAYKLEPRPEIQVNLGKAFYTQGSMKRAVEFFSRAVQLDPRLRREVPADMLPQVLDALRSQNYADGADED